MKVDKRNNFRDRGVKGAKHECKNSSHQPLKGRVMYLDLQGYKGSVLFEENLKLLGATIEKCFSKEIKLLITNRGHPKDYGKASASNAASPGAVPSPFSMGSVKAGIDSPMAESPATGEGSTRPMTRGKAIANKVNMTKNFGTTNVVEMARQWNIKTVHCEQVRKWLEVELAKVPSSVREEARKKDGHNQKRVHKEKGGRVLTKNRVDWAGDSNLRRLRGCCVKFESTSGHYRPLHQELDAFPVVNFSSPPGTCPFDLACKVKGQAERDVERAEREEERDGNGREEEGAKEWMNDAKAEMKKEHKQKKPSPSSGGLGVYCGKRLMTAGELKRMQREKARAEQKKGYCELCEMKYDNIDKHVRCDSHREFVRHRENYDSLDSTIAQGPNLKKFMCCEQVRTQTTQNQECDLSDQEEEVMILASYHTPKQQKIKRFLSPSVHLMKSPVLAKLAKQKSPRRISSKGFTPGKSRMEKNSPQRKSTSEKPVPKETPQNSSKCTPTKVPQSKLSQEKTSPQKTYVQFESEKTPQVLSPRSTTPQRKMPSRRCSSRKSLVKDYEDVSVCGVNNKAQTDNSSKLSDTHAKYPARNSESVQLEPTVIIAQTCIRTLPSPEKLRSEKRPSQNEINKDIGFPVKNHVSGLNVSKSDQIINGSAARLNESNLPEVINVTDHVSVTKNSTETPKESNTLQDDKIESPLRAVRQKTCPLEVKVLLEDISKSLPSEEQSYKANAFSGRRKKTLHHMWKRKNLGNSQTNSGDTVSESEKKEIKAKIQMPAKEPQPSKGEADIISDDATEVISDKQSKTKEMAVKETDTDSNIERIQENTTSKLETVEQCTPESDTAVQPIEKESKIELTKKSEVPITLTDTKKRRLGERSELALPATLERSESTNPSEKKSSTGTSSRRIVKKVKLDQSWSVLSDRSMQKLLDEDSSSPDFEGFGEAEHDSLPSDMSYEDVSEIILFEDVVEEDLDDNQGHYKKEAQMSPIKDILGLGKLLKEKGKENVCVEDENDREMSSEWDTQVHSFVEERYASAQKCRRSPRKHPQSPRKSPNKHFQSPRRSPRKSLGVMLNLSTLSTQEKQTSTSILGNIGSSPGILRNTSFFKASKNVSFLDDSLSSTGKAANLMQIMDSHLGDTSGAEELWCGPVKTGLKSTPMGSKIKGRSYLAVGSPGTEGNRRSSPRKRPLVDDFGPAQHSTPVRQGKDLSTMVNINLQKPASQTSPALRKNSTKECADFSKLPKEWTTGVHDVGEDIVFNFSSPQKNENSEMSQILCEKDQTAMPSPIPARNKAKVFGVASKEVHKVRGSTSINAFRSPSHENVKGPWAEIRSPCSDMGSKKFFKAGAQRKGSYKMSYINTECEKKTVCPKSVTKSVLNKTGKLSDVLSFGSVQKLATKDKVGNFPSKSKIDWSLPWEEQNISPRRKFGKKLSGQGRVSPKKSSPHKRASEKTTPKKSSSRRNTLFNTSEEKISPAGKRKVLESKKISSKDSEPKQEKKQKVSESITNIHVIRKNTSPKRRSRSSGILPKKSPKDESPPKARRQLRSSFNKS